MFLPSLRRFRAHLATGSAAFAVAALGLTACSQGADPEVATARAIKATLAAVGTDRARQAQQYIDCMRSRGVVMLDELTSEGMPQVDKARSPFQKVAAGMDACKESIPSAADAPRPAAADVERMRRYAACLRSQGLSDYPDPDPQTGEPALSEELALRLKQDPRLPVAERACASMLPVPSRTGTVGG